MTEIKLAHTEDHIPNPSPLVPKQLNKKAIEQWSDSTMNLLAATYPLPYLVIQNDINASSIAGRTQPITMELPTLYYQAGLPLKINIQRMGNLR